MYVFLNFSCAFLGLPQNLAAGFQDHVGREREGGRKRGKEAGREKGHEEGKGEGRESGRKRMRSSVTFLLRSCRSSHLLSVQFSRSVMSDSLRPHESQHARPPCPSPTPRVYSNSWPSSRWCHPAISSSVIPSPPAPNPSQHQGLFQWVNSSHEVAKVLEFQLQHQSFQ